MKDNTSWERFRSFYQYYKDVGIALDISTMHFSPEIFGELNPALCQALEEMKQLEAGAIANPDEQRRVGHYWLRRPSLAPEAELQGVITKEFDRVKSFCTSILNKSTRNKEGKAYTDCLVVGIGGSALGPQFLVDALSRRRGGLTLSYCDNTDPDGIARILDELKSRLSRTLVVVVSKSGGTVETKNGMLEVEARFRQQKFSIADNFIAITTQDSKLDDYAKEHNWRERFYIWDWVGGRTSICSAVGVLPGLLAGIDMQRFLDGAAAMDELTRNEDIQQNPATLLATMWYYAGSGKGLRDMVVIPYKDRLRLLSNYLQQLVMESLGKEFDRDGNRVEQGIAVYGNKGSTDQHAYVQQLRDGINNFFVTFVEVLHDYVERGYTPANPTEVAEGMHSGDYLQGFLLGTRQALAEKNRDSLTITLHKLDANTIGALIALYERAVGIYASLINVNAYHQPGVEAGKKAAGNAITLKQQLKDFLKSRENEAFTLPQLADELGAQEIPPDIAYKLLEHLCANSKNFRMSRAGDPKNSRFRFVP